MATQSTLIENRMIRVFISSTFEDLQDERTELIRKTFPRLREMAAQRDVTLTEVDLRWGITQEESESGKVMEICLREVENSIPFFIGIIGNRYGWVPGPKDISEIVKERFSKVPEYVERHLSATEIEMQFGVLNRTNVDMNAYFFIKGEEVPENEILKRYPTETHETLNKLAELKKAVRENKKYPWSTYSDPEDLANQVLAAFTKLLDDLFPVGELSALEKERLGQRAVLNNLSRVYIKNESNYAVIDEWMEDWEKHQLVITGESGLGKSALVANWVKKQMELGEALPYRIIYHFVGFGGSIGSDWHVTKALCDEIRNRYGFTDEDEIGGEPKTDEKVLDDLFKRVAAEGDKLMLIVLDGINQIIDVNHSKRLNWLPIPPKKVKILFTTLEDDETMQVFKDRHYPVFTLQPLTRDERIEMVRQYLDETYRKHLEDTPLERIVDDPQNVNTLVLKTLLDEVANFGDFKKLGAKIEEYLKPDSIGDFYQAVLQNYEADFGKELVRHFLSLIAVSRDGLSEDEILEITGIKDTPFLWSQFFCSFRQHMVVKNGLISFSHNYIREAVEERFINGQDEWVRSCREEITDQFKEIYSHAAMREIPYQYDQLGEWGKLHDYINDYRFLFYCMDKNEVEIGTYWRHIEENLPGKYSLRDYLNSQECEDKVSLYVLLMKLCIVRCYPKIGEEVAHLLINHINESPSVVTPEVYIALSNSLRQKEKIEYAEKALILSKEHNDLQGEIASYRVLGSAYYEAAAVENDKHFSQMAYDVWEKAKDLSVELYGGELHPSVMHCYEDLSMVCDDLDQALKLAFKSLELSIAIYGSSHPLTGRPYHYVGVIYSEQKKWEKALLYFQEACRIWISAYGIYHELLYSSYVKQGNVLMHLGRLEDALKCYDICLQIIDVIFDEPVYEHAFCHLKRAKIYASIGRRKEAISECEQGEVVLKQSSVASQQRTKSLVQAYNSFKSTI